MDINLGELQEHYKKISKRELIDQNTMEFQEQFHNVGNLNIQSYKNKQISRIIRRFDGSSIYCYKLSLWKMLDVKKKDQKQFQIENVSFHIEKQQINGIYSSDNSAKYLIKFLSLRNPSKTCYSQFDMYIDNYHVKNIHKYQRLFSFVSNYNYLDTQKTPLQTLTYFAKIQGHKNQQILAKEIIELVGLQGSALTPLYRLKKGQYKRCQIGAELIRNPKLLCLQNPFNDLLYHEVLDLINILRKLSERGLTIVFTFDVHTLKFLQHLNKIIILSQGRKFFEGDLQKLRFSVVNLTKQKSLNTNILHQFVRNIDTQRFQYINEDLPEDKYCKQLDEFQQKIQLIIEKEEREDYDVHEKFLSCNDLQSDQKLLMRQVQQKKHVISCFKRVFVMYQFELRSYIKNGLIQFNIIQALLISVIMILNIVYKPHESQITVIAEQNLSGIAFVAVLVFYVMGLQLSYRPLKHLIYRAHKYGLKNKFYTRATLLVVIEMLSITQNLLIGTVNYLILKVFYGNWFNVRSTVVSWVLLVIATMSIAKDTAFLMAFFFKNKSYLDIGSVIFLVNFLMLGYFVQIKSVGWYIRWIAFLVPLRNVFQGILLNAYQRGQNSESSCNIKFQKARSQFCSPLVYQDFYEYNIGLNFLVFVIVFIFYKILFVIMFYIWSREKNVKRINAIV